MEEIDKKRRRLIWLRFHDPELIDCDYKQVKGEQLFWYITNPAGFDTDDQRIEQYFTKQRIKRENEAIRREQAIKLKKTLSRSRDHNRKTGKRIK
ncbi:hypothetical protein LMB49_10705 [Limosilactobacillus reuteri]|nr:hypothetical protein [Limosilactobacillus reuteri]MCC4370569.1 hypothetical protein [Limosilactobacillus reuteri]MCC4371862.1 hypothetical protein [Limosilactobacillus reuteri]